MCYRNVVSIFFSIVKLIFKIYVSWTSEVNVQELFRLFFISFVHFSISLLIFFVSIWRNLVEPVERLAHFSECFLSFCLLPLFTVILTNIKLFLHLNQTCQSIIASVFKKGPSHSYFKEFSRLLNVQCFIAHSNSELQIYFIFSDILYFYQSMRVIFEINYKLNYKCMNWSSWIQSQIDIY